MSDGLEVSGVVYEWWVNGYPYKGDESVLFSSKRDADAYRDERGEGQVFNRSVMRASTWTPDVHDTSNDTATITDAADNLNHRLEG